MRRSVLLAGVSFSALILTSTLVRADGYERTYVAPPGIGIDWEVGARYWYSTGHYKKDLFDSTGTVQLSRLTYDNLHSSAAETFFRGGIGSFFVKGIVGGGSITSGKLNDEDFFPAVPVYSNTLSQQKDGNLGYFTSDVGFDVINNRGAGWGQRLGGFVGYGQWHERLNAFGCDQLSAPAAALGVSCNNTGNAFNTLDNDATWRMLRVGAAGDVIFGRWKLSGEAAYVVGRADATDWHNQRPDIRGIREDADGRGVQAEAAISYFVTPSFTIGTGVRYWHIAGDGITHFEDKGGVAQANRLESERIGMFVQGSLKLARTHALRR
jgi:hypothetical protein